MECTKKLVRLAKNPRASWALDVQVSDMVKTAKNGMRVSMALAVISTKNAAERAVSMAKLAKKNAFDLIILN